MEHFLNQTTRLFFFYKDIFCVWTVQGRAGFVTQGSHVVRDHASQPLFSSVDEIKLNNITTISRKCLCNRQKHFLSSFADLAVFNMIFVPAGFMKLLDNYERSTGIAERVTTEELTETNLFLDAIVETEVMKVLWTCYNQLHLTSHSTVLLLVSTALHSLLVFCLRVRR